MALSLYRKYRPNVFSDVVGQEHVEKTLVNAVTEGNVAHAYLFCGPRGTGKTTTARLLAKALLCEQGPNAEPDGTCGQCKAIAEGAHPDVYELDAASRTGVENVREEIIGRVNFAPTRGRFKVYIVDEVHMLSTAAFNALLKTLEEPPEHVVFVLCTTDPQKVPETIQSRCQRFDFRRFSIEEIVGYLQRICEGEGFAYEPAALEYIAAKSNGGMRDATTSLEQMAVFGDGSVTLEATGGLFGQMDARGLFEVAGLVAAGDAAGCFVRIAQLVEAGVDLTTFARELAGHFRDLYVTELTGGEDGIVACPESELPAYRQQAALFGAERLSRALTVCGELVAELRHSSDSRLSTEIAFTRLVRPESDLTLEALSERIARLEEGGAVVQGGAPALRAADDARQANASALAAAAANADASGTGTSAPEADSGVAFPVEAGSGLPAESAGARGFERRDNIGANAGAPVDGVGARAGASVPSGGNSAALSDAPGASDGPAGDDSPAGARSHAPAQDAGGSQSPQTTRQSERPEPVSLREAVAREKEAEEAARDALEDRRDAEQEAVRREQQAAERAQGEAREKAQQRNDAQAAAQGARMSPARILQAVLTELKREDVATSALLSGVTLAQDGGVYHFEFPPSASFAMNLACKGKARELIAQALERTLGAPVQFDCRVAGQGSGRRAAAAADPAPDFAAHATAAAPPQDDGYLDALAASASFYDQEPAGAPFGQGAPVPNFDEAPGQPGARPVDAETAASLGDALSVFGNGVRLTEVDPE